MVKNYGLAKYAKKKQKMGRAMVSWDPEILVVPTNPGVGIQVAETNQKTQV